MELTTKRYRSISYISGPLLFVEGAKDLPYGAIVNIHLPDETVRGGQVIEVSERHAVIQVFEETRGLDLAKTSISLRENVARLGISRDMIGRRFSGLGNPIDGLPPIIPEKRLPIIGAPINPVARERPQEFIQTGISSIDGLNTLVRGQKLPIFSGAGLPQTRSPHRSRDRQRSWGRPDSFRSCSQRWASPSVRPPSSSTSLSRPARSGGRSFSSTWQTIRRSSASLRLGWH